MNIKIEGLKELQIKLDQLEKISVEAPLTQSTLLVEGRAKENCPVDTGQLKNSITSEIHDNIGYVGTNVEYAAYVHQGTGIYAVNGDGRKTPWSWQDEEGNWHRTVGQPPQPFLEQALDSSKDEILEIFQEEINKAIRR